MISINIIMIIIVIVMFISVLIIMDPHHHSQSSDLAYDHEKCGNMAVATTMLI